MKVSSSEDFEVDVEGITDRVLDAEFDSDSEKEAFLTPSESPTNLSEHTDTALSSEVESDD